MHKTRLRVASLQMSLIGIKIAKINTIFLHILFELKIIPWIVLFLVIIKARDLKYIFPNLAVNTDIRSRANVSLTPIPLLIQTSKLFFSL